MHCKIDYIGLTRTKLKKKIESHYNKGSILNQYKEHHHHKLTKKIYKQQLRKTKIMLDDQSVSISSLPLVSAIEKNLFLTILIKRT